MFDFQVGLLSSYSELLLVSAGMERDVHSDDRVKPAKLFVVMKTGKRNAAGIRLCPAYRLIRQDTVGDIFEDLPSPSPALSSSTKF